jgi:hypothetical protein
MARTKPVMPDDTALINKTFLSVVITFLFLL